MFDPFKDISSRSGHVSDASRILNRLIGDLNKFFAALSFLKGDASYVKSKIAKIEPELHQTAYELNEELRVLKEDVNALKSKDKKTTKDKLYLKIAMSRVKESETILKRFDVIKELYEKKSFIPTAAPVMAPTAPATDEDDEVGVDDVVLTSAPTAAPTMPPTAVPATVEITVPVSGDCFFDY